MDAVSPGWFSRLFTRSAEPSRVDGRQARTIIEAYASCLEHRPSGEPHRPERELPYLKEAIGRAILLALRFATRPETAEPLRHGFVELERFLADDEWVLVEEYQRRAAMSGSSVDTMAPDRRNAAIRVLRAVDERRARRVELLAILERETDAVG